MIILFLVILPIFLILIKLILFLIVKKYGKISYDGLSVAGFAYHSEKDIFYSTKNAWQKNFGYTHMYDVFAPVFRMIIDTESIKFHYDNKNWLISFWKGQYGIVTGAEIGIYCTKNPKVNKKTLYLPVKDSEMLDMRLILYKKGEVLTKVEAKHWWLAIFKLGMFSKPKDLTMDVKLTFSNQDMLHAFLKSFKKLGYKEKHYTIINNTFYFTFIKPRTPRVWTRFWLADKIRQFFNKKNVELYNTYLGDLIDDNRKDDSNSKNLIVLKDFLPDLLKGTTDEIEVKRITKKIIDDKNNNIVFLNSKVASFTRVNKHD